MRRIVPLLALLLAAPLHSGGAAPAGAAAEVPPALPSWLSEEEALRLAAGEAVPTSTSTPLLSSIQPGSWMLSPAWCTMNFVFRNEQTERLGIGTAGHCAQKGAVVSIVRVLRDPAFPLQNLAVSQRVGTVVERMCCGIGNDFALVLVDVAAEPLVDPAIRVLGGPCGSFSGWHYGVVMAHYGHGLAVGTGGTPRLGIGHSDNWIEWSGVLYGGDSGSPVRWVDSIWTTHQEEPLWALGVLTHGMVAPGGVVPLTYGYGTAIARILATLGPAWVLVDDPAC